MMQTILVNDEAEDRRQNPTKPLSNNKADVQYTQSELPRVAPYSYNCNSDVSYENICYVVGSTGNADGVETKAVSVCCMLPLHGGVYVCVVVPKRCGVLTFLQFSDVY